MSYTCTKTMDFNVLLVYNMLVQEYNFINSISVQAGVLTNYICTRAKHLMSYPSLRVRVKNKYSYTKAKYLISDILMQRLL